VPAPAESAIQIDPSQGRFRVARSAYVDPQLHAAEIDAIFSRCWLFVGHDSEIPAANDFVTRAHAGRAVVFLRFAACNLDCPGCDTDFSPEGAQRVKAAEIAERLRALDVASVYPGHGEPA